MRKSLHTCPESYLGMFIAFTHGICVCMLCYVIVLRRISDYGYITASLQSPFTTRWGYGGRIIDLNPGVLTGVYVYA